MMKLPTMRFMRIALTLVILGFVASAIYISALVFQRQTALEAVGLGNVTWMVAQTPAEFARLQQRISAYGLEEAGVDAAEVKLRFDIVINRVNTLRSPSVARFMSSDPRHERTLDAIENALNDIRPMLGTLDTPGTTARMLDVLEPVYPKIARLSTDANVWNIARIEEDRHGLFALQWAFAFVAIGMIACGLVLVALLLLHNRLLSRTQGTLRDKEQTLQVQNARFDAALNTMSLGLCLLDADRRVIVCNARFLQLFGLDADLAQPGTPLDDLVVPQLVPPEIHTLSIVVDENGERDAIAVLSERTHHMPDGMVLEVLHEPMVGGGWVCTYEDITERQRAQDRVVHMAHHDALTDMPNRILFWENTAQALRRLNDSAQTFAILYLDLDRFKEVNDTLGHPVGDALLREVAERLRRAAPSPDIVARLGGDEFAILHYCFDQSAESARQLAERLLTAISSPYQILGNEILVSTSIGIALAPADGNRSDQLMKNADLAMYRAKADGANSYRFFSAEMETLVQSRRQLEMDLRRGINLGQFELHYQPLVCLKTRKVVSGEALMRWRHPERGLISPAEFIPLAEETGFIDTLGEWALRQACTDAMTWPEDVRVSVNLSPVQFRESDVVETVKAALDVTGFSASRLELEITESVLLQNNDANLDALHRLRALGSTIALDDFGTGYSSLSYLQRFPFDKIKIDQSFVRDLENRPDSFAIVQSVASLGRSLKMVTTAEGVETLAQLRNVAKAGVAEAQGYYFSMPLKMDEFRAFVQSQAMSAANSEDEAWLEVDGTGTSGRPTRRARH